MPLILSAYSLTIIKWWVDTSYSVHPDTRGHTGSTMSFGGGYFMGIAKKHKMNMKSSTKAELIGSNDALPQILWTQYSIEAHGFTIDKSIRFQDNLSAILLERNGMVSRSRQTKHIRVRYYFIKDQIYVGDIVVKHCPPGRYWQTISPSPCQVHFSGNSGQKYK